MTRTPAYTSCLALMRLVFAADLNSGFQRPLVSDPDSLSGKNAQPERIAIIGAGIAGAKAAFDLHESNRNDSAAPEISIFEEEARIGGRIHSNYGTPKDALPGMIEEGALHFFTDDWCLLDSMRDVGLKAKDQRLPPNVVEWRKDQHRAAGRSEIACDAEDETWKELLARRWRYGRSWSLFRDVVRSSLAKWKAFGGPYRTPFSSILDEFNYIEMPEGVYSSSANTDLDYLNLSTLLQNEHIQPCTRARFSKSLTDAGGLASLIAAGKGTTTSVEGGNSRLVERLIRLSYADVRLNSSVIAINPGSSRRYEVHTLNRVDDYTFAGFGAEFDIVIIAAPLDTTRLHSNIFDLGAKATRLPRNDSHITHFSSIHPVSANSSTVSLDVSIFDGWTLTTSSAAEPDILNVHRSNVCFRRYKCYPGDECDECEEDDILYRVHSRRYLTDADLIGLIGHTMEEGKSLDDYGIHFVRRKLWPDSQAQSRDGRLEIVNEIKIAPGLYYLNGADSVIDSMEMSCRMAGNVAHLVNVKRWGF